MQEGKLCSGASKVDNGEPHLTIEPKKHFSNHVHVLRFEVLWFVIIIYSSLDYLNVHIAYG